MKESFIEKYVNSPSPSGFEMILGGQKVWIDEAIKYADRVDIDDYGNAYAILDSNQKSNFTVLLDAHADEIGFVVFQLYF